MNRSRKPKARNTKYNTYAEATRATRKRHASRVYARDLSVSM